MTRRNDMRQHWLDIQSFLADQQVLTAIDDLAIATKFELSGIVDEELALSYPVELRDDNALLSYRARWLGNDPSSYAATYRMLASLDMLQSISSIQCRSLFLAGTLDPLRPPDMIEPLARVVPNAKFKAIWSGHVMAWQSPRLLHQETSSFWNEVHTSTQPHGALP